jgi:Lrp/AsnC family transcriptional regulator for asnA, asnC and gidA
MCRAVGDSRTGRVVGVTRDADALDKLLVGLLEEEGRLSLAAAASRTGVSRPTVAARLRSLVADGVVRVAGLVDAFQMRGLTTALVGLSLDKFNLDEKVEQIAGLDEVTWAAVVTGRYDIIVEVMTEDGISGLYNFLSDSLGRVGGISSSEMFVVMKARNKWSLLPAGLRRAWTANSRDQRAWASGHRRRPRPERRDGDRYSRPLRGRQ